MEERPSPGDVDGGSWCLVAEPLLVLGRLGAVEAGSGAWVAGVVTKPAGVPGLS